jgi:hypothetical protein
MKLGPMPPHPGRVPQMFKRRTFWIFAALNLVGVAICTCAAYLDATHGSDFLLALACVNLSVQLVVGARLVRATFEAFRGHRELLNSWEQLRQAREQIKARQTPQEGE